MTVFELMAKISLDSNEYDAKLREVANRTGTTVDGINKARKVITGAAVAGAAALGAFGVSSVKTGMEFDKSMSQVAATMGTTTENIQNLREYAKEMGATTAFSATQAADAMNYMALAGYDAQTTMQMLPNVLNLAAAGGIDLAYASDMITDSQSALGLSLEQTSELVDKMAKAASKSNTSVAQLGEAILTVGGTAKNLAGGTTELSTALGILADNGIKGSEGGTALRNIILSLSAPTDKAAQLIHQLGLEVFDAEGNMRPLNEVFGDLNNALSTMTQEERTNVLSELFNKVDLKSVNALLGTNVERWQELTSAIDESQGAAQQMADTQLDNLAGDITLLKSAFEGLQISVSERLTPYIRIAVQGLTELIGSASQIAGAIAPAAAAFGAFAIAINVVPAINAVKTAFLSFYGVLAANPIGLAIALMAGLAVAAYNLATHFSDIYTEADKAAEGIRNLNRATESGVSGWVEQENAAKQSMDGIQSSVDSAASGISDSMGSAGSDSGQAYRESLTEALSGIDADLASQISTAMEGTASAVEGASSQIGEAGTSAVEQYASAFENGEIGTAASNAVTQAVDAANSAASGFSAVGQTIATQISTSINAGAGAVSSAVSAMLTTAIIAGNVATGQATAVGQNVGNMLSQGIASGAGTVSSAMQNLITTAVSIGNAAAVGATAVGQNIGNQIASGASSGAGVVSGAVRGVIATAIAAGNAATAGARAIGQNIARGIAAGISAGSGAIAAAARSAVQSAVAAAKAAAAISSPSKKFRDEVGVFMGLGIAEGLEDSEDKVIKAAKELAEKTYRKSAEWLRRQTKFNKLTLAEQLEVWQEIQSQYIKESKQWIDAEEEIFDIREKIQENFAKNTEKLWENIEKAQKKYDDALEDRIEDIAGAYKLFDDVQDREAVNADDLTTNLLRQVNVLGSFYSELEQLSARGVSAEMVEEIRDMGPKAIDQLEALLSMSDEQLSEYATLFGEKQRIANETALKELSGLKKETDTQVRSWMETIVDNFDNAAKHIGDVTEKVKALEDELRILGQGGNVDLLNRPIIDASKLLDVGWEDAGEGKATVFSSTFSDETGTRALNFTPIIADKNGKFIDVLEPDALWNYAERVIEGVQEDYLGLQIGSEFIGADAIEQAERAAERIHELHEQYYLDNYREKMLEQDKQKLLSSLPADIKEAVKSSRDALQGAVTEEWAKKTSNASRSILGAVSEQVINALTQSQDRSREPTTINLTMADGSVMAKWIFNPLKDYASAKGQPIVNAT